MKKIVLIFISLLIFASFNTALAGGDQGNGTPGRDADNSNPSDQLPYDIFEIFENVVQQILAAFGTAPDQSPLPGATLDGGCFFVDIDLPDSVTIDNNYSPMPVTGHFLLANCSSQEAEITLSFEFSAQIGTDVDTTFTFGDYPVSLQAGDSVIVNFPFPVPAHNAIYTLCVTAAGADSSLTDCATMHVYSTGSQGTPFSAPGFLVQGDDCILFAELGDSNAYLIVENLGDFQPGDSVLVSGLLVEDCDVECTGSGGCVIDNTITSWPPPPPPPPSFEACGLLTQGENCVLFTPLGFGDTAFVLDNYGTFEPGDTVNVSGLFVAGCETDCIGVMGCITENTIEACSAPPPPPQFFAGCGIIQEWPECLVFVPNDTLPAFILFDYSTYQAGDSVFVEGDIVEDCGNICNLPLQCIDDYLISTCDSIFPPPPPPSFADCGILVQGSECVLFQPVGMGDSLFQLLDYGSFVPGDSVFVSGTLGMLDDTVCSEALGLILNDVIDTCGGSPPPPPPAFDGCGLLVESTECTLFHSDELGDSLFMLSNYGDFIAGDSVHVSGELYIVPDTVCSDAFGIIANNSIELCGLPPGQFSGCGILHEDQGCLIFQPDSMTEGFLLYNYGDFQNYDTVYVEGEIVDCGTPCNNVIACIDNPVIETCDITPPPPPPTFEGCGYLLQGGDCVLFKPLTWMNDYYILSDYADYQVGDTIYVSGQIGTIPDTLPCPGPLSYIQVSSVDVCPSYPGSHWQGVGVLYSIDNCLYFQGLGILYTAFELENYGDFGEGDTVYVDGTIDYSCQTMCLDSGLCLIDNTISGLPGSDTLMTVTSRIFDVSCRPNPFNPVATISFNLSSASHVNLAIYNILGQRVETLIDEELMQGPHEIQWNGDKFASGIYFYRIVTNQESITKKMVLSK